MADNIIMIELQVGMDSLDTAIDKLEALGAIDKKTAADFKAASQDSNKFNESLKTTSTTAAGVTAGVKKMGQEIKAMPKKILDKGAEDQLKVVDKAVGSLKSQLRQLNADMSALEIAGKRNTAEYRAMAAAAGQLKDQIGDTAATIRVLASDTKHVDALIGAVQGLAGGFAVVTGATALFGKENEDLQKALLKVNAAMAIVQGLQAVQMSLNKDEAASIMIKSYAEKLYGYFVDQTTKKVIAARVATAALLSLGVAAIVLGIVYAFKKFNEAAEAQQYVINGVKLAQEDYVEVMSSSQKAIADTAVEMNALLAVARDETKTKAEQNKAIEQLNDKYGEYLGNITQENKNSQEVNEQIKKYIQLTGLKAKAQAIYNLQVKQNQEYYESLAELENERDARAADFIEILKDTELSEKSRERAQRMVNIANGEYNDAVSELNEVQKNSNGINQEYIKIVGDIIALEAQSKGATNETTKAVKDKTEAVVDYMGAMAAATGKAIGQAYGDARQASIESLQQWVADAAAANGVIADALMSADEAEIKAVDDKYEALLALAQKYNIDNTELLAAWQIEKQEKLDEQNQRELDAEKEKTDAILEQRKRIYEYTVSAAQEVASLAIQFSQQQMDEEMANLEEQLAHKLISQEQYEQKVKIAKRKAAAVNKLVAGFNVVIDTAQSISKTGAELGYPAAIPFQVLAGIIGAAQLALIAGQKVPGFAVGTKNAPAGFKWVGEKGPELINDGGGYPIITAHESKELASILGKYDIPYMPATPDVPNYEGMAAMMAAGMAIPAEGINYDKLAAAIARNPQTSVNIDERGFTTYLRKRNATIEMLNKTYSSN